MSETIDYHNLGTFATLEEVYKLYSNGGSPGDYVTISGVVTYWDDAQRRWGNPDPLPSDGEETKVVDGNLSVGKDLAVSGDILNLYSHFMKLTSSSLLDETTLIGTKKADSETFSFIPILSIYNFLKEMISSFSGLMDFSEGLEIGNYTNDTGGCFKMIDGKSVLNVDQFTARERATFKELLIETMSHVGGNLVVSPARMYCTKVEEGGSYFRCYFDRGENEDVNNEFVINDQAICQIFTGSREKYYWRLVSGVGVDYIDLSYSDHDSGSGFPEVGDTICQLGNRTITERQNAQIISSFGDDSPSFKQYAGICDYSPLSTKEVTKFSPSGNKITGEIEMTAGSKGWENLDIAVGGVNLLRNTGFTGDYQPADLTEDTELEEATPLFSNPLKYWNGTATIIAESAAISGFAAVLSASSLYQSLASLIVGEHYVMSFHAKGTSITASLAGFSHTIALTENYEKYYLRMVAGEGLEFMLTGTATLYDIQLERGTIATGWTKSPLDNDKSYSEIELLKFVTSAIKDGRTSVNGGLILSSMIMLGNFKDGEIQKVTSGINGIYNDDDDVAFFAGGTLEDAIKAVAEPSSMTTTKFVVTHGGKVITNEGYFRGAFACANGKIMLNADGSGHLANGLISWDTEGTPVFASAVSGLRMKIKSEKVSDNTESVMIAFLNSLDESICEIGAIDGEIVGEHAFVRVSSYEDRSEERVKSSEVVIANGGVSMKSLDAEGYMSETFSVRSTYGVTYINASGIPSSTINEGGLYVENNFLKRL